MTHPRRCAATTKVRHHQVHVATKAVASVPLEYLPTSMHKGNNGSAPLLRSWHLVTAALVLLDRTQLRLFACANRALSDIFTSSLPPRPIHFLWVQHS